MKRWLALILCILFIVTAIVITIKPVMAENSENNFEFDAKTGSIIKYLGAEEEIEIPDKIADAKVIKIGDFAFMNSNLTSITIPDSVTSIGEGAFAESENLKSVLLPNGLKTIKWCTFYDCTSLSHITIPNSVTFIVKSAFMNCTSLKTITLPDKITSIETGTFLGCKSLSNITIPKDVTAIYDNAFYGCQSLSYAAFTGNAPAYFGANVFTLNPYDFAIRYKPHSKGFTAPKFKGYPSLCYFQIRYQDSSSISCQYTLPSRAAAGRKVKLNMAAENYKKLNSLYYIDDKGKHRISDNCFVMPSNDITIVAKYTWAPWAIIFFGFSYFTLLVFLIYIFRLMWNAKRK